MATDEPPILLPCAICARTFKPQSLEKHTRICERAGIKKRKPFDSAKQRIQGTELAEFLPKQEKKRTIQEDRHCKPKTSWKQTHNEFLRAIRAARGEVVEVPTQRHGPSVVPTGAPTRANEKGMCPTCNRLFGIKAYDRHVAWCKERAIRLPISPATNIAKERLEARMKYRAPALKNRRLTNREKYSPGSAINLSLASKSSPPFITTKAKESTSVPNCNKGGDSPINPKTIVARRPGQNRDQPVTSGTAKSRLAEQTNSGTSKNYDPFLLAEHQMNELFSDTSEQSITDSPPTIRPESTSPFPLSHSSAFVKYPSPTSPSSNKRASVIAPPSEFDDFISDFSSDSTETNSTSQEIFINDLNSQTRELDPFPRDSLTRHVIIDRSKLLTGNGNVSSNNEGRGKSFIRSAERTRKILEKVSPKIVRPTINRSQSVRASSAPKAPERKSSVSSAKKVNNSKGSSASKKKNDYAVMSGSNLSLNSIVSSTEANIKRSNSAFDELISSFEDDGSSSTFPSLKSLFKNDSMSLSSPVQGNRQRNGQVSDEELSSPDSYKRSQDHSKLSADSAYSSLNRKYSNHGRSTNDVASRLEEEASRRRDTNATLSKYKMSKFCHECGSKFPETAKFCCECGIKRLAL